MLGWCGSSSPPVGADMGSLVALLLWQGAICTHSGKNGIRVTHANQNRMCSGVKGKVTSKCMTGVNPLNSRGNSKPDLLV